MKRIILTLLGVLTLGGCYAEVTPYTTAPVYAAPVYATPAYAPAPVYTSTYVAPAYRPAPVYVAPRVHHRATTYVAAPPPAYRRW